MRKEDINGFWIYENTPLTKEGVFPYKGRQIDSDGSMGLDPNRIYMVYRPAKELTKKDVLESFNGLQFTDEHQMLGKGQRDVGTKRMDGTVYNVHVSPYQRGVVLCTLKVMSEAAKDLISQGKRQLSCGYYCDYKPEEGVFNGHPYQFVQTDLVGNHVALVKKGRMGEQCAVCDSALGAKDAGVSASSGRYANDSAELTERLLSNLTNVDRERMGSLACGRRRKIACDSAIDIDQKGMKFMPTDNNDYSKQLCEAIMGLDKGQLEKLTAFVSQLGGEAATGGEEPAKDDAVTQEPAPAPADPAAAPGDAPAPTAEPAALPDEKPAADDDRGGPGIDMNPCKPAGDCGAAKPLTEEEFQKAVDAAVNEKYAREDEGRQLAEDLSPLKCGNLWKRGMDADDVAEAACEKLGKGQNLPKEAKTLFVKALADDAKGKQGEIPAPASKSGMDSACEYSVRTSVMSKYLNGK